MPLIVGKGDITLVEADVIVNAANSGLAGGGGVDGAIHRAAGPSVMAELDRIRMEIGHCPAGKAVVTRAGRLRAKHIVHAVGPVYQGGGFGEAELLASCYREAIRLAGEHGAKSIAFPAISTGAYRYPLRLAAEIAIREVRAALERTDSLEIAHFILFDDKALHTFELVNSIP